MDQPQSSRERTSVSDSTTCTSVSVLSTLPNVALHTLATNIATRSPSADAATRSPIGTKAVSSARVRVLGAAVSACDPNTRLSLPTPSGGQRPRSQLLPPLLLPPAPDSTSVQPHAAAQMRKCIPTLEEQMRKCNIGDFADVEVESGQIVRIYTNELQSLGLIGAVLCFCLLIRSYQQFSLFAKCT